MCDQFRLQNRIRVDQYEVESTLNVTGKFEFTHSVVNALHVISSVQNERSECGGLWWIHSFGDAIGKNRSILSGASVVFHIEIASWAKIFLHKAIDKDREMIY